MEILIWIIVWGAIGAGIAQSRSGEAIGGFVMGALLGPIGVAIAWIYRGKMKNPDAELQRQGLVKCPHCAEFIRPEAKVCKHCGRDVATAIT